MKRLMLIACMVAAVVLLFACGKRNAGGEQPKGTGESPAGSEVSAGAVSGNAAVLRQLNLSDGEAFAEAEKIVKDMTLEEKVAQMFLVDLSALDSSAKSDKIYKVSKNVKETLAACPVGGIYLSEKNVKNEKQAKSLIEGLQSCASGSALYIAVEEEGGGEHSFSGKVEDLEVAGYLMPADVGNAMNEDQLSETAGNIARELRDWGINLNLGLVADVSSEENSDYGRRCFSSDTSKVEKAVSSYVKGMRECGMSTTLRYFPGIGNVAGDTTKEILQNQDSLISLRNNNFKTYTAGIKAGTDCIMVSNVAVPKVTVNDTLPAFLSDDIVTSLLRQELDFEGVIMTPPLNETVITKNYTTEYVVVEAVKAGCDMLVQPSDYKEAFSSLLGAVRSGEINEKVINTSVRRILQDKIQRGIYVLEDK